VLRVGGLPRDVLEELCAEPGRLAVIPAEFSERRMQAMEGSFEVDGEALIFTPRFPFVDRMTYALLFGGQLYTIQAPALKQTPTTRVTAIYPTTRTIPENLLRLYIHFSAPMSEGFAAGAVTIRGVDFVFLPEELWDPERRRLTLLLDPGRIKRGLLPHNELGLALRSGTTAVVAVDTGFSDAEGRPLSAPASRHYVIYPAVRRRVEPSMWRVEAPPAGAIAPLVVFFDRPLDHALAERCLRVDGVRGTASVGDEELSWTFVPEVPWRQGDHLLQVDSILEDLAGNSLNRVFDRDLTRRADDPLARGITSVPFQCR
jgi:hypothetical protein